MPYLVVEKNNLNEVDVAEEVEVPNIEGMTISDAKQELEKVGLEISYEETEEDVSNNSVVSQMPISGVKVNVGSNIQVSY